MSRIIPIPTSRVGDFFIRQRLSQQVLGDQLALFRLQNQVSTGQRLQLPSDDAPAALRAISLQRLLDRKAQIKTNLQANGTLLAAAESTIGFAADQLVKLRGEVQGVAGTLASDAERQAVTKILDQTLQFLVNTGNTKSQGQYLFAGSRSITQPYDYNGDFVEYFGNESNLQSYVDLDRLFAMNVPGSEIFGGISEAVQGIADLNPHLSDDTLLSTINASVGISRNAAITIAVQNGPTVETSIVDLSGAATVGDVARMIEAGAPTGTTVTVEVTGDGLVVRTSAGTISITEVAAGTAAKELGIFTSPTTPPSATITGSNLNPAMLETTRLDQLLGTKSQGRILSTNLNNDIILSAAQNGASLNGLTVEYVAGGTAGSEVATYAAGTNTLTVQIQAGVSTAAQVAAAINTDGTFTAAIDYRDATSTVQAGSGTVGVSTYTNVTSGGSGESLDTTSGLILTNGGESKTLDISTAETVEDVLNLINGSGLGLHAEINAAAAGINVRSRLSGADLTIGENGGTTATQLGIRTYNGSTRLADFNRGQGVPTTADLETLDTTQLDNLRIIARDGTVLSVSLAGVTSLQDVADRINTAPGNFVGTTAVDARLTAGGNGIELADASTATTGDLIVEALPGNQAAQYLGFITGAATQSSSSLTNDAGDYVLSGTNVLGNDLLLVARDGTELWLDLAGATTVQDVMDRINNHPENNLGTTAVLARLAVTGNGIELVDSSTGAGALRVEVAEGSPAAQYLGFVAEGATQSDPSDIVIDGSGNQVLTAEDRHTLEADSVFNTLLRLRTALEQGDVGQIAEGLERLDSDLDRLNFARAEMGIRLQDLEVISVRLEDENVQLRTALSEDIDIDFVEAISNLTARQFAYEASLRTAGTLLQMSLLDFI